MSERDTHFKHFARLLLKELDDAIGEGAKRMESGVIYSGADFAQDLGQIIARRAYDLVYFLTENAYQPAYDKRTYRGSDPLPEQIRKSIEGLPDMTAFPDEL